MSIFQQHHFSNSFAQLPSDFFRPVSTQPIDNARLLCMSQSAAELIGLSAEDIQSEEFLAMMAGVTLPQQAMPIATVYSGHQFGGYNPKLGDGRALLLGEITHQHQPWELQLKGAGLTPFSRMGDGRAVLRSSIREFLCSEAMHHLGVPTTRALAIVGSTTPVYRERVETAATILRMAPSHIRFGHFEYFCHTHQHDLLQQLADFVISKHFQHLAHVNGKEKYSLWFDEIAERTAKLIAKWQAVGFCHGVMNTDNMSILGLTLDYGPFAFIDDFNPNFICNHSDDQGRYAYKQQINIGLWNLNALAHALTPLIEVDALKQSLARYELHFITHFRELMSAKLGLQNPQDNDDDVITGILSLLASEQRDYHFFFRQLSYFDGSNANTLRDLFINRDSFDAWLNLYQERLSLNNDSSVIRLKKMQRTNPKYVLRNYLAQQAIEQAEFGNTTMLNDLLTVLETPFDEHADFEHWAQLPPDWGKHLEISCSS